MVHRQKRERRNGCKCDPCPAKIVARAKYKQNPSDDERRNKADTGEVIKARVRPTKRSTLSAGPLQNQQNVRKMIAVQGR